MPTCQSESPCALSSMRALLLLKDAHQPPLLCPTSMWYRCMFPSWSMRADRCTPLGPDWAPHDRSSPSGYRVHVPPDFNMGDPCPARCNADGSPCAMDDNTWQWWCQCTQHATNKWWHMGGEAWDLSNFAAFPGDPVRMWLLLHRFYRESLVYGSLRGSGGELFLPGRSRTDLVPCGQPTIELRCRAGRYCAVVAGPQAHA